VLLDDISIGEGAGPLDKRFRRLLVQLKGVHVYIRIRDALL
jgi:hypothetical protein